MMIHGYEGDSEKLTAVYITDQARNIFNQRFEIRPHGEWIEKPWGVVCSRCKAQALHTPNGNQSRSDYCPDCGALMRKEGEAE